MSSQRGAAVVEFAIVLPLLLIILFGIIEFGLIMYNKHIITNASREGARYGIVVAAPRRTPEQIRAGVLEWINDNDNPDKNLLATFGDNDLENTDEDIQIRVCKEGNNCGVEVSWQTFATIANPPIFGDKLRVRINYDYDFLLLPDFILTLPDIKSINAETVMNYE